MMESLPDSCLLLIFSKLRYEDLCLGVRMCCHHWRSLTFDRDLWRHIIVPAHFSNCRLYLMLQKVHEHVEDLDLSSCDYISQVGLMELALLSFPRLKKLSVPITGVFGDSLFLRLSQSCPVLEELEHVTPNLDDTCNPVLCQMLFPLLKVLNDRPVAQFGRIRKSPQLQLDVQKRTWWQRALTRLAEACDQVSAYKCCRGMEYIDGDGFKHISESFSALTELELRHCSLTDKAFQLFAEHNKVGGLSKLIMDKPGDITDESLSIIAEFSPKLTNLKLSRCALITNSGVLNLTAKCKYLTELHLNNSPSFLGSPKPKSDIDNSCLKSIGENCPLLLTFRLFYSSLVSTEGFQAMLTGCKNLRGLMLYECAHISDDCLETFLGFPHLRALILVNSSDVTPRGIINFILKAPTLARLSFYAKQDDFLHDLSSLAESTYEGICLQPTTFHPNVLKFLTLRGVGSSFIQLITVLCPALLMLDLRSGCFVDSVCLKNVVKNCEILEELDVSSCDYDCESSLLSTVSEHCTHLRKLAFGGSVNDCSHEDLYAVIQSCQSLRLLTLNQPKWPQLKEEELVAKIKEHHGGQCCVKIDKEFDDEDSFFLDLHFTPIKYLNSVPNSKSILLSKEA
ncbi:hypothetical protein CAPTEDRAFT_197887 [Capitella teleta]|uniref:F-box domain-containing protein n=1 Tax=Capitella teleta TaxID=283909 RepID=R7U5X7_CAPTE|nr:hypothetical protein CAPTEDRAFT_197887 [Capitella teleta]|eukprot:ELU01476.1 hypothetical protein CAPTEDRAFT_197887 [Capitella teleta]